VKQPFNSLIKAIILEREREKAIDKEFRDIVQADMEACAAIGPVLLVVGLFLWVSFCMIIPNFKMYIVHLQPLFQ